LSTTNYVLGFNGNQTIQGPAILAPARAGSVSTNTGVVVSTSNNFNLSVQRSGLVNNGTLQAGGQLSVTGSNNLAVSRAAPLAGAGTVQWTSNANTLTLSGSQFTAGDITVTANGSAGVIVVNSTPSTYTLKAGGNITFTSANTGAGTSVTNSG